MKVELNSENFNAYHLKFSFFKMIPKAELPAVGKYIFFSVLKQKLLDNI